ncbi:MAG: hypothetical protein KJ721_02565 [Nanoarchaeota archaeon]|nr:hypothetical protein [Nanoarchaeota archaeon]
MGIETKAGTSQRIMEQKKKQYMEQKAAQARMAKAEKLEMENDELNKK